MGGEWRILHLLAPYLRGAGVEKYQLIRPNTEYIRINYILKCMSSEDSSQLDVRAYLRTALSRTRILFPRLLLITVFVFTSLYGTLFAILYYDISLPLAVLLAFTVGSGTLALNNRFIVNWR